MRYLIPVLLMLLAHPVAAQNPFGNRGLYIKQGTITVSGSVSGEFVNFTPEGQKSESGFVFTFAPSVGYFINENVSLTAAITTILPTGDLFDGLEPSYILSVGAIYYHGISNFYIYAGLMGGYLKPSNSTESASNNTLKSHKSSSSWYGSGVGGAGQTAIIVPAGVLFPITSSLAFDVGLRGVYIIDDNDNAILDIAIGWFGLQAFF